MVISRMPQISSRRGIHILPIRLLLTELVTIFIGRAQPLALGMTMSHMTRPMMSMRHILPHQMVETDFGTTPGVTLGTYMTSTTQHIMANGYQQILSLVQRSLTMARGM